MSAPRAQGGGPPSWTLEPALLAQELPDFEIVRQIGLGSMGVVLEARRRRDGARVALKVLPAGPALTERALARFLREAAIMAKVRHPAIVPAFEHRRGGRLHWFAMELVDGVSLAERLRVGPLPLRQATQIAVQVARALQCAHEHGVLHRDVKPSNLMLRDDGRVAVTDFGLARETGDGSLTESGSLVGTPMYMAPEQITGGRGSVGTRSDVYGLGCTLYELLTGAPPFRGDSAEGVLRAVLEREPPPPRRLRRDLPPALEAVVQKAIEKEPAHRYGSAEEMADDLERFLRGERVLARRRRAAHRIARAAARHPALTALALTCAVLAAGALGLWQEQRGDRLQARVREAQNKIALAAGVRDDQFRPLSPRARRDYLLAAVQDTTAVIEQDPALGRARFVRAQALHGLQRYEEALADLDAAARAGDLSLGSILHFRIDTLRRLPRAEAPKRLLADLTELLRLERGSDAQGLVAETLVDFAAELPSDRAELLARAETVLEHIPEPGPRATVTRARALALRHDFDGAERVMHAAAQAFPSSPLVHQYFADLLATLGRPEEAQAEARLAHMLDPLAPASGAAAPPHAVHVDVVEMRDFLEQLDDLMSAIRPSEKD